MLTNLFPTKILNKFLYKTKKIRTFFVADNEEDTENIFYTSLENNVVTLINSFREQKGLKGLKVFDLISIEAIHHNYKMIQQGVCNHHNFTNRHKNLSNNFGAKFIGENIAENFKSHVEVFNLWVANSDYKENMENPKFNKIGISCRKDDKGKNYITCIFIGS